ncbi:hypothetical protein B0I35DRAFT_485642 [Stachybotrys elegans]|uniref:F-box domain-containing protein n=1 Tax=Stachybotrys elegans TaxID=80388 RepID=A0A8K0WI66_9HYPO|nr:hypothetical protein B0I35DRAFT_485642 [Stachybotrys elegans]
MDPLDMAMIPRLETRDHSHFNSMHSDVIIVILEQLDDVPTLLSVIRSCKSFFYAFSLSPQHILRRIFARQKVAIQSFQIGTTFMDLKLAIKRDIIPREAIEETFAFIWPDFTENKLEELLVPLARELAATYCLKGRYSEAERFLWRIWNQEGPYASRDYIPRSPVMMGIGRLLLSLSKSSEVATLEADLDLLRKTKRCLSVIFTLCFTRLSFHESLIA